jgi:dihydroorotate dehydrogenase
VSERVKKNHSVGSAVPLGVNLGKNADSESASLDYEIGCNYFAKNCEYLVINVSSPNTKNLRSLQSKDELVKVSYFELFNQSLKFKVLETTNRALNRAFVDKESRPKLLVKITSDLSSTERRDIARVRIV